MKYRFGIMTQVYELESDDSILAEVAMCIHFKVNAPLAIYSPDERVIIPEEVLRDNLEYCRDKSMELLEVMKTIKELKNG